MVIDFAEFFRETLKKHGEFCTLAEELDYVDKYLEFERARLGHRLQISREVEPEALELLLPVLVIQPLVENAVNHGLAPKPGGGHVSVCARSDGPDWLIWVEDDGVGISEDSIRRVLEPGFGSGLGMGLSNVNQRLVSIYGPAHHLEIESAFSRGTRVTVRIPRSRAG
jgi:two-component system LytT family sensor kinase